VARIFFDRRDFGAFRPLGESETVEYRPPVDVIETADSIEVVADLPGLPADSVRITFTGGRLVIAGRKRAPLCAHREAAFHLAERTFGHFACVVRCEVAVDAGRARATFARGELHVVLPRIDERRGREIPITVESPDFGPAST
jgi:HSP20 family protein